MFRRRYTVVAMADRFPSPPRPFHKFWTWQSADKCAYWLRENSRKLGFPLSAWVEKSD